MEKNNITFYCYIWIGLWRGETKTKKLYSIQTEFGIELSYGCIETKYDGMDRTYVMITQ